MAPPPAPVALGPEHALLPVDRFRDLRVIGQLGATYILCEGAGELIVVDQHAAHERHLHGLLTDSAGRLGTAQRLVTPLVVELTRARAAILAEHLAVFEDLRLDVEPHGATRFVVRGVPPLLAGVDVPALISDLADELSSGGATVSDRDLVERALATMACHASVRARDPERLRDARALAALDEVDFGVCAHGRPVAIRIDEAELEASVPPLMSANGPSVLVLAGPTASGKTEAAIAVAERFDAVVLSADAMQVYIGMDIGTAKASVEERARATHLGIDVVPPDQSFDAADFVQLADEALSGERRVVVAGGTSLYIQALIRGLVPTPPVDPGLRAQLEALDDPHARLAEVDPDLAARLHPNDRVRVVRGPEVFEATGQRLSALQAAHARQPDRVRAVGLWLDRDDLGERIEGRLSAMVRAGYLDEVRGLLDAGYHRGLKPMHSLGYRHLCDHLLDGLELDEALRRTQRDTWRFARKQRNWMRVLGFERLVEDHVARAIEAAQRAFG